MSGEAQKLATAEQTIPRPVKIVPTIFATTAENLEPRSAATAQIKHKPMIDKLEDNATQPLFRRGDSGQINDANPYRIEAKRRQPT
jgi:hypothetical protein